MPYIFFFKQKTAYEMRISDWSSDVCASDLRFVARAAVAEIVAVEDARFLEQADGAIDGSDRNAAVERRGALVKRLHVGMILGIRNHARDDASLLGDPQPLFVAQGFKVDR